MARTNASELKFRDQLRTALDKIGDAPTSDWLIHTPGPTVAATARPPRDAVSKTIKHQVFVQYARTEPLPQETSIHRKRAIYYIWLVAVEPTDVGWDNLTKLHADALRAIWTNEGPIGTAHGTAVVHEGPFVQMEDLSSAGISVGLLTLFIEYETGHDDP